MVAIARLDGGEINRGGINSQTAFAAATEAILPALRGYARRLTQNEASTDDLVQETLIRAWAARTRFLPGSNFRAWLFRIARNAFLTGVRRSWRSTPLDPVTHAPLLIGAADQEDGLYRGDFGKALATLPTVQREALLLVVEGGLTYDEAAETQHVEPGTLKSRVARARSTLMRYFDTQASGSAASPPVRSAAPIERERDGARTRYEAWKASGARTIG